jgi:hypothetical protein
MLNHVQIFRPISMKYLILSAVHVQDKLMNLLELLFKFALVDILHVLVVISKLYIFYNHSFISRSLG